MSESSTVTKVATRNSGKTTTATALKLKKKKKDQCPSLAISTY